jgi:hypothetical protein
MSQNTQNPYFYTLDGATSDALEVVGATSLSIFTQLEDTLVVNIETGQEIYVKDGLTLDLNPDSGCTLQTLRIYPNEPAITYVVMIGGTAINI